jgi:predicted dehydrogenase
VKLRWGALSTARIVDDLLRPDPARFVAVASRSRERAEAFARARGIPRAYGAYDELLADPEIDAVYVALPNSHHVEWSVRALAAGKHVLCEKPLARDADAARSAFDAAARAGRVLAEALMWRHHPQVATARRMLADGAIGELRLVRASASSVLLSFRDPGDIRLQPELDGGALMDAGCYCVSGLRTLAGAEPVRVQADRVVGRFGVDMRLSALLRFPGDVLGVMDCGFDLHRRQQLEAIGDAGRLVLDDPWLGRDPTITVERADGAVERRPIPPRDGSYALELEDFEAAVRGERAPLLGREDAEAQAAVIDALARAAGSAA